jgi:hypothetical protein
VLSVALACPPAQAQHRARPRPGWHGDIQHFRAQDWQLWRHGHWMRTTHDGRYGWWWLAGGLWYAYPSPVYPVPNPYEPPLFDVQPALQAPGARVWYYCASAATYYPYVAACPEGWNPVPVTPPAPLPPPVQ